MYPHERSLVQAMANKPFALIGVNSDSKDRVLEAMERENITWPSFFNGGSTRGPISKAWGVHSWPTIYVMDQRGVIRFKNVRGEAMSEAVDKLVEKALAALADDIKSDKPAVRGIAAFRMGKYNVPKALSSIKPLLNDGNPEVQQRAAIGLVLLGQPTTQLQPLIRKAVGDADMEVRLAALETLGKIKDAEATRLAMNAIEDPQVAVRRLAVQVLGQLGDPAALPALAKAVDDTDVVTARNAAYALADLKSTKSIALLKELAAKTDHPSRVWITVALHRAGQPGTAARFTKLIADPDPKIRRQVVTVLPDVSEFDATDLMIGALEDTDAQVGKEVRAFLAQSDSPRARKALKDYLIKRIDQLIPVLGQRDYRKQSKARAELLALGPEAAPMLFEKLKENLPPSVSYMLGSAIGASGNTDVLAPATERLMDPKLKTIQRTTYESILRGLGTKARDSIKQLVASEQGAVRLSGIRTLLTARDSEATGILHKALKDPDDQVRVYAAYAMAMRHDPDALPVLKKMATQENPAQLPLVVYGLSYYGEDTALPILTKMLSSDKSPVRSSALLGLGRFRSKKATTAIAQAAAQNPALRLQAMSTLYRQNTTDAARVLGEYLKDKNPKVREQALMWLQRMRVLAAKQIVNEYKKAQQEKEDAKKKKAD